jgi:hypothetical protein
MTSIYDYASTTSSELTSESSSSSGGTTTRRGHIATVLEEDELGNFPFARPFLQPPIERERKPYTAKTGSGKIYDEQAAYSERPTNSGSSSLRYSSPITFQLEAIRNPYTAKRGSGKKYHEHAAYSQHSRPSLHVYVAGTHNASNSASENPQCRNTFNTYGITDEQIAEIARQVVLSAHVALGNNARELELPQQQIEPEKHVTPQKQLQRVEQIKFQRTKVRVPGETLDFVSSYLATQEVITAQTREIKHPPRSSLLRPCILLGMVAFMILSCSLSVALWWSFSHRDVSSGFTVASYIVAIAGLPIGFLGYKHSQRCRCWVVLTTASRLDSSVELTAIARNEA